MSGRLLRAARLIQRAMVRLLPARIRQVHRDAMEVAFSDALEDAQARGRGALLGVLLREFMDLLRVSLGARLGARAFREARVVDSAVKRPGGLGIAIFTNDLRHGIRLWIRRPGFALLAVMTAAIGIAATTAMWTIADGVLYRPLPYAHANRLVMVWQTLQSMQGGTVPMSYPNISDIRSDKTTGFEEIAWYSRRPGPPPFPSQMNRKRCELQW